MLALNFSVTQFYRHEDMETQEADAEYAGEDECEYNGQRYAIYRTFRVPQTDDLELYAERKAGVIHGTGDGT